MIPSASPSLPSNEELLQQCAQEPGTAFRTLVERYAGLVRATAWRQTADFHAAEDIVQTVFCALVREAAKVKGATLGAWLHRRTLYEVSHWRRAELRRRRRERIAYEKTAPPVVKEAMVAPAELDAALNILPDKDREMLLLRCVERRDWRSIGALMGLTDDTAQKRVARAIEKVRRALAAQGVIKSGSALTGVIALSAAVPPAHAFAPATQVAATVLSHAGTAAAPASSSLGGMFAAAALPVVMLATGIVLPLTTAKKPPPARPPVISAAPAPPAEPAPESTNTPVPDAAALRAMLKHNTQLERRRVRRAFGLLDAPACQAVLADFAKAPGALSNEHEIYAFLRLEAEERWIHADTRHAALSGYLQHNNFPERAIRYLATKDFPAAQSLAAEARALWRPGGDPYYHDLIGGLASVDVHAALAFQEASAPGFRNTALDNAAETQPEEVLRIISSEKLDYAQRELWNKALPALARTDPHRALTLYRSRDFPDEDAVRMEEPLVNAMMAIAPDLAEKEVPKLRHSVPAFAAFLAKRDAKTAIAYAMKHPEGASSLEAALVYPDPVAAMKKWSPASANKVEQGLWWAAARIRASWLIKDHPPSASGARALTEGARTVITDIFAGIKQSIDAAGEPPPGFAGFLRQLQTLDPVSAAEMAAMIPEKWGPVGVKIRTQWLEQSGAATDDVERETAKGLKPENTAAGYFEFALKRIQHKPEAVLAWAHSLTGEAKLGALAGLAQCSAVRPEIAGEALNALLALNQPDHPLVARGMECWAAGQVETRPEETSKRVAALPRGPVFDAGADGLSQALTESGDPGSALQWAAAIGNPFRREVSMARVLNRWCYHAESRALPQEAVAALDLLKVPETLKRRLVQKFAP